MICSVVFDATQVLFFITLVKILLILQNFDFFYLVFDILADWYAFVLLQVNFLLNLQVTILVLDNSLLVNMLFMLVVFLWNMCWRS